MVHFGCLQTGGEIAHTQVSGGGLHRLSNVPSNVISRAVQSCSHMHCHTKNTAPTYHDLVQHGTSALTHLVKLVNAANTIVTQYQCPTKRSHKTHTLNKQSQHHMLLRTLVSLAKPTAAHRRHTYVCRTSCLVSGSLVT